MDWSKHPDRWLGEWPATISQVRTAPAQIQLLAGGLPPCQAASASILSLLAHVHVDMSAALVCHPVLDAFVGAVRVFDRIVRMKCSAWSPVGARDDELALGLLSGPDPKCRSRAGTRA